MRYTYNLRALGFRDFENTSKIKGITAILILPHIDINTTIVTYANEMTCWDISRKDSENFSLHRQPPLLLDPQY